MRAREIGLLAAIVAMGCLLRGAHLATPNLWWDELVHVRTAERPGVLEVLQEVKQGIPPGAGNAGAVPLDYLLLHGWLRGAPAPSPRWIEVYYRAPAVLYSCLALLALWAFCHVTFGLPVAAVATTLLALSMPHVLYAAEARFYSLFVLTVVVNLWTFARLCAAPESRRRWLGWVAASIVCVATGSYGAFLLAAEFLVLGVVGLRTSRRVVLRLLAAGMAIAALIAAYLSGTSLGAVYGRGHPVGLTSARAVLDTARFFALDSGVLTWAYLVALPVALLDASVRSRSRLPLLIALALAVLAIPAMVQIAYWKQYYFHPRHALFLLPGVLIATALALVGVLGALTRGRWVTTLGLAAVAAVAGPIAVRYLRDPAPFFARTKTERDFRAVVRHLQDRVATAPLATKHLVLVERNRPGYLANPLLALYVRLYGLEDRVIVRGFSDPATTAARVSAACVRGCRGRQDAGLEAALGIGSPFAQVPAMRRLIDLREPVGVWPADVADVSVIVYSPVFGDGPPPGLRRRAFRGLAVLEPLPAPAPP